MRVPPLHDLPPWAMALSLGLHLAAGGLLGILYFGSLRWSTQRFVTGGGVLRIIVATIVRFGLLAGMLVLASLEGAMPLLAAALGLLVARQALMRRLVGASP